MEQHAVDKAPKWGNMLQTACISASKGCGRADRVRAERSDVRICGDILQQKCSMQQTSSCSRIQIPAHHTSLLLAI